MRNDPITPSDLKDIFETIEQVWTEPLTDRAREMYGRALVGLPAEACERALLELVSESREDRPPPGMLRQRALDMCDRLTGANSVAAIRDLRSARERSVDEGPTSAPRLDVDASPSAPGAPFVASPTIVSSPDDRTAATKAVWMIVSAFVGATVGGLLSNLLWLFLARSEPPQDLPGLGGLVGIIGALIWTWSYLGGGERADLLRSRTIKGAWMVLGAVGGFGALAMIVGLSVGALTGQSAPSSVGGVVLVAGPIVGLLITVPLLDGGRWGWSRLSPVASVWVLMIGAYLGSAVLLGMVSIWMGDVATASEGNEIAESPRPAAIAALAGLAVGAYIASRFLRVRNAAGSGNDR